MNKLAKNILYGTGIGISLILTIAIYMSGRSQVSFLVGSGLILMYVLIVFAVVAAAVMAISALKNSPGKGKWVAISIGVLLLLIGIGYGMDSRLVKNSYLEYGINTSSASGLIGGALIATWVVLGLAILVSLYTAFSDFKNRL
jgi:threonine/homoserine/homoserine lactone efflux protein